MPSTSSQQQNKSCGEKTLEKYLIKEVKKLGGLTIKLSGPNQRGCPDRLIILPENKIGFLELKSTGKKPTTLQIEWMTVLDSLLGCTTDWADSKEKIDYFLTKLDPRAFWGM